MKISGLTAYIYFNDFFTSDFFKNNLRALQSFPAKLFLMDFCGQRFCPFQIWDNVTGVERCIEISPCRFFLAGASRWMEIPLAYPRNIKHTRGSRCIRRDIGFYISSAHWFSWLDYTDPNSTVNRSRGASRIRLPATDDESRTVNLVDCRGQCI